MSETPVTHPEPGGNISCHTPPPVGIDPRVTRAMEEYQEAREAGRRLSRQDFLTQYADIAEQLAVFLDGLDFIHQAASELDKIAAPCRGDSGEDTPVTGTLGDFRLVRQVGRGGMGIVYEAEQISLGRRVALKVLPFAATMDLRQLQRFHNEARAAACLHHTNIVPVFGVGQERGVHFYAMQFIDGQSLAAFLEQERGGGSAGSGQPTTGYTPSPSRAGPAAETAVQAAASTVRTPRDPAYFRRVAAWGIQAAEALDLAHQMGIIHRDVKPANLLIDANGRLWVTDFGLAQIQTDTRLTMTGDLVGTLRYMSPEQALAKRVVIDHRTDIYSLGATLYELLALQPAFEGSDRQELLRQLAFEEPRRLRRINKAIPAELETIVRKALEKNPKDRYATAQELADDLRRWLEDKPILARRPSLAQRLGKWRRRHRALVRTAGALALVVLLLGGAFLWREQQQRDAIERAVEASLERVEFLREQERWEQALAVLTVAEGQLEGRGLGALRDRVHGQKRDVEMLTRLEKARLQVLAFSRETGLFDQAGADRLFAEAFNWYDLDLTALNPQQAAERVRASAISTHLIVALEHLASRKDGLQKGSGERLRATADLADADPWSRQLRAAARRGDRDALEKLAERPGTLSQPPANLLRLAGALQEAGSAPAAERLCRRAQQQHPADLWTNFALAQCLSTKTPPDVAEEVGFRRAALALRPGSFAAWFALGTALERQKKMAEAEEAYRKAIALEPEFAAAYYNLGALLANYLRRPNEAARAFQKAIELRPGDVNAYCNLAVALRDQGKLVDAAAACHQAIALDRKSALAYRNLGSILHAQKKLAEAEVAYHKAIRLKKDFASAYCKLGNVLVDQKRVRQAEEAYRKAIALKKDYAEAYCGLGITLAAQKKLREAEEAYCRSIDLKQDVAGYFNLGNTLAAQKKLREAEEAYRKAIALKKDFAEAYCKLGNTLAAQNKLHEAEKAYRKVIALKKDYAEAYINLAVALYRKGELEEAITELRKALRLGKDEYIVRSNLCCFLTNKGQLDKAITEGQIAVKLKEDYAEAHWNLGLALWAKGQFRQAVERLRRGHELGSRRGGDWTYPSAEWLRQAEQLPRVDERLSAVLEGKARPKDSGERLAFGELCLRFRERYAAAAGFYQEAFATDPKLAKELNTQHRYHAACAAARAGCGRGKDAAQTDDKERDRLREQALEWLRADLAAWHKLLNSDADKARAVVQKMQHWQQDADLAGVRGPKALAKLPEHERPAWEKLWVDVADTLAQAKKQLMPKKSNSR